MVDLTEYKFRAVALRNGFGFDVDIVDDEPVWVWSSEEEPGDDMPSVATFTGMHFHLPFIKISWGSVFSDL